MFGMERSFWTYAGRGRGGHFVRPILAIVDRRNNLKVAASYCPGHYFCDQRMAFVALKEWHFWHSIVNVAFSLMYILELVYPEYCKNELTSSFN